MKRFLMNILAERGSLRHALSTDSFTPILNRIISKMQKERVSF